MHQYWEQKSITNKFDNNSVNSVLFTNKKLICYFICGICFPSNVNYMFE